MASKRVLILTEKYPPFSVGGYEMFAADVASLLASRGFEVTVLASEYGRDSTGFAAESGKVHRILESRDFSAEDFERRYLRSLFVRARMFRRNRAATREFLKTHGPFDLVLCFRAGDISFGPLRAAQDAGVPVVIYVGDSWVEMARDYHRVTGLTLLKRLISTAGMNFLNIPVALYIATSRHIRQALERTGVPSQDIIQIEPITDLSVCAGPAGCDNPGFQAGVRLMHGGRLCREKGSDLYVEVVRELVRRRPDMRLQASLFGNGEASFMAGLRDRISSYGLGGALTLHPMLPEADFLLSLKNQDFFVFPFRWDEPYGRAPIQAMACGAMPVCTNKAGPGEIIRGGETGILVDSLEPEAFAEEILNLVDDEERYRRIRSAGMAFTRKAYDRQAVADIYAAVVGAVIGGNLEAARAAAAR